MDTFHLYQDIQARTKGEIYIGVVGRCEQENPRLSVALWSSLFCRI